MATHAIIARAKRRLSSIDVITTLADLCFPRRCVLCGCLLDRDLVQDGMECCTPCLTAMKPLPEDHCCRCALPFETEGIGPHLCQECLTDEPAFDRTESVWRYEEPIQSAILGFKFHGKTYLRVFFRDRLAGRLSEKWADGRWDLVVPVPLHRSKLWRRGYNQALLLALGVARGIGTPVARDMLRKKLRTSAQSVLSREERKRNIASAFEVAEPRAVRGKRILVIDDVMTTGSTLRECARKLKEAGAERVDCLTLARAA